MRRLLTVLACRAMHLVETLVNAYVASRTYRWQRLRSFSRTLLRQVPVVPTVLVRDALSLALRKRLRQRARRAPPYWWIRRPVGVRTQRVRTFFLP